MTSPISREQLAQIRELAWVLPSEKIGSAQDTIKGGNSHRAVQWVMVYEQAPMRSTTATDALEEYFQYRPGEMDSNSETVMIMTGRLWLSWHRDVDEIGGSHSCDALVDDQHQEQESAPRIRSRRGGNEGGCDCRAYRCGEINVLFVRSGLVTLLGLDQQGRQKFLAGVSRINGDTLAGRVRLFQTVCAGLPR